MTPRAPELLPLPPRLPLLTHNLRQALGCNKVLFSLACLLLELISNEAHRVFHPSPGSGSSFLTDFHAAQKCAAACPVER